MTSAAAAIAVQARSLLGIGVLDLVLTTDDFMWETTCNCRP